MDATQKLSGLIGLEGTAVPETTFHVAATLVTPAGDWQFSDVRPYAFLPPPPA